MLRSWRSPHPRKAHALQPLSPGIVFVCTSMFVQSLSERATLRTICTEYCPPIYNFDAAMYVTKPHLIAHLATTQAQLTDNDLDGSRSPDANSDRHHLISERRELFRDSPTEGNRRRRQMRISPAQQHPKIQWNTRCAAAKGLPLLTTSVRVRHSCLNKEGNDQKHDRARQCHNAV